MRFWVLVKCETRNGKVENARRKLRDIPAEIRVNSETQFARHFCLKFGFFYISARIIIDRKCYIFMSAKPYPTNPEVVDSISGRFEQGTIQTKKCSKSAS